MQKTEDGSSFRRIVVACAFFAAALVARFSSLPLVLRGETVQPAGSDAFYHLRRILYSVENFPQILVRDPYLNFPHGGEVIWSPAFDWLLAAFAWATLGAGDVAAVERLLVWVPPILGAATVAGFYLLVGRHFGERSAVFAAAFLCVLPAHVLYSRIGAIDHHVAVALCFLWMLSATMHLFKSAPEGTPQWWGAVSLGASIAAGILIWPGMLFHLAILQVAFAVRTLTANDRDGAIGWAWSFALAHALAAALTAPLSLGRTWEVWGAFSPVVASTFQPAYLLATALGFAALAALWRASFPPSPLVRALQAALVAVVGLGLCWALLPALSDAAQDAWAWLTKAEEFQAVVAESAPLFWRGRAFEAGRAELLLSRGIYLMPVALLALAWPLRRGRCDSRVATLVWVGAALLVATLLQRRFMNSFSLLQAWILALALDALLGAARQRLQSRALRATSVLAGGVAVIFLLLPIFGWYANDLANVGRLRRGEPVRAVGTELIQTTLLSVAGWLRENTPPTQGFFDLSKAPEYALLSAWGDGHVLTYAARRPEIQGNFGDDVGSQNFEMAEEYFSARNEGRAWQLLDSLGARYIVVGRTGSGHAKGYAPGSMWSRLYRGVRDANTGKRHGGIYPSISLTRHRLVHTSRRPPANSPRFPFYAVYERVEGARVDGRASPGATVSARLKLVTEQDGELRFTTETRADEAGRYRLHFPYANGEAPSSVRVGQRYRLHSGGREASLSIDEASVQSGAIIAGPDLSTLP